MCKEQYIVGYSVSSEHYVFPSNDGCAFVPREYDYDAVSNSVVATNTNDLVEVSYTDDGYGYVRLSTLGDEVHTIDETENTIIINL